MASHPGHLAGHVVALHCSGGGGRQWRRLAERLAPDHRLIAPDLIGSDGGGAWEGQAIFSLADEAASIIALIDRLEGPVHLVGHSYGGGLALHIAARRPERLASLSLRAVRISSLEDDGPTRPSGASGDPGDRRRHPHGPLRRLLPGGGGALRRLLERRRRLQHHAPGPAGEACRLPAEGEPRLSRPHPRVDGDEPVSWLPLPGPPPARRTCAGTHAAHRRGTRLAPCGHGPGGGGWRRAHGSRNPRDAGRGAHRPSCRAGWRSRYPVASRVMRRDLARSPSDATSLLPSRRDPRRLFPPSSAPKRR
ncbi:alpha/beta fold hydrolase [Chelatococcus daeguensis]|uniref:alpha/beta fold hydrolase n=1 Tax=Chelatococcus daeguensis TaxID=444444 RepID=UPI003D7C2587